jgi:tetratricopeptide (TPR) repeat protein
MTGAIMGKHVVSRRSIKIGITTILWIAFAVAAFGFFLGGFIGKWLVDMGRPQGGIAVYRSALMIYPWNAAMRNDLGLALLAHGDAKGAVDELRKAVALRPDVSKLHNHLGFALFKDGDIEGAIQAFQEAVRLTPEHEDYRRDLDMAIMVREEGLGSDTAGGSR